MNGSSNDEYPTSLGRKTASQRWRFVKRITYKVCVSLAWHFHHCLIKRTTQIISWAEMINIQIAIFYAHSFSVSALKINFQNGNLILLIGITSNYGKTLTKNNQKTKCHPGIERTVRMWCHILWISFIRLWFRWSAHWNKHTRKPYVQTEFVELQIIHEHTSVASVFKW